MYPQDPFNVCTVCTPFHIDNCPDCFGFGHYTGPLSVPVNAGDVPIILKSEQVSASPVRDVVVPCPTCHSTLKGITVNLYGALLALAHKESGDSPFVLGNHEYNHTK